MSAKSLSTLVLESDEAIAKQILMSLFEKSRTVKKSEFMSMIEKRMSAERLIRLGIKRIAGKAAEHLRPKIGMSIVRKNGDVLYVLDGKGRSPNK